MGQREDAGDGPSLPGDEVVASVPEAFFNDFFPTGQMEEGRFRLGFDEAVPSRILAVQQAIDLEFVS
jgi:hypothetical protein